MYDLRHVGQVKVSFLCTLFVMGQGFLWLKVVQNSRGLKVLAFRIVLQLNIVRKASRSNAYSHQNSFA